MSGPKGMSLSLRAAVTVAARDLLEFVRDRRTLVVTLLMPMAMYPVLALSSTLGVRTAVSDQEARRASARLAVVVSGAEAEDFAALLLYRLGRLPSDRSSITQVRLGEAFG